MATTEKAAQFEADDKLNQETSQSDSRSSTSETIANNVEDEKPSENSPQPSSSKPKAEWNGPDDPENPQNWSQFKKWCLTFFAGAMIYLIVHTYTDPLKQLLHSYQSSQAVYTPLQSR